MCQRFFFSDNHSEVFCLPIAPGVIVICCMQAIISICGTLIKHGNDGYMWIVLSVVTVFDCVTGLSAVLLSNAMLGLAALIGFAIECVMYITVLVWWYLGLVYMLAVQEPDVSVRMFRLIVAGMRAILVMAAILVCFRTMHTMFMILQLGGNGWERKSPRELRMEFGHKKGDEMDASEAQLLLDPEADLYTF
eukprot:Lankesteria_metandrocarpae@DN445_c0_g1_i1.p1